MSNANEFEYDFPLHVVKHGRGFAAIVGEAPGLGPQRIPVIFRDAGLAEQFVKTTGKGQIERVEDREQFVDYLKSLPRGTIYVAFDPHDGNSKYNVLVSQLL